MKRLILLIISIIPLLTSAQRIVGELESNTDMQMTPGDSTLDNKDKKENKFVPVDVRAWNIDNVYGNRIDIAVDTTLHQFHNSNLSEGLNGHYNHLGNLGSPRINRIF